MGPLYKDHNEKIIFSTEGLEFLADGNWPGGFESLNIAISQFSHQQRSKKYGRYSCRLTFDTFIDGPMVVNLNGRAATWMVSTTWHHCEPQPALITTSDDKGNEVKRYPPGPYGKILATKNEKGLWVELWHDANGEDPQATQDFLEELFRYLKRRGLKPSGMKREEELDAASWFKESNKLSMEITKAINSLGVIEADKAIIAGLDSWLAADTYRVDRREQPGHFLYDIWHRSDEQLCLRYIINKDVESGNTGNIQFYGGRKKQHLVILGVIQAGLINWEFTRHYSSGKATVSEEKLSNTVDCQEILPRPGDEIKWQAMWTIIKDYIAAGKNASDIKRDISLHPNRYEDLPDSLSTLRKIIKAGRAGCLN